MEVNRVTHDERVLRARAKARRLRARAFAVSGEVWRVKCFGTCRTHAVVKAGAVAWHIVRMKFQSFFCDCDGAQWGNPCVHVGAVERRLIRASYRALSPAERAEFRKRMAGFSARAA